MDESKSKKKIYKRLWFWSVVVITFLILMVIIGEDNFDDYSLDTESIAELTETQDFNNTEIATEEELSTDEEELSTNIITAIEVGKVLKDNGIPFIEFGHPFPPQTYIIDGVKLSPTEKGRGMLSKSLAASKHDDDIFDWRIEVYESITARNNARLQMVENCPGCSYLTECGEILIYVPDITQDERKRDMTRQAYSILRDNLQCK